MTERNPADVTQCDIELCMELNIPDYNAPIIARHRLQQSRSAVTDADLSDSVLAPIVEAMYGNELSHDCDVEGLRRIYRAIQAALSQESADA